MSPSDPQRDASEPFDVAVIGGGIHGAGVAQAAAAAGYSTLLVERDEWAAATSRASSKLVHGGLRYLESAQLSLVRHSLLERARLLRNAPQLVQAVPFYIPIYRHTRRRPWQIRTGLALYALLAGLRPEARFRSVPRSEWSQLGGLREDELQAVFQYWDGQTDDRALTQAVANSAARLGAHCVEHCELLAATQQPDGTFLLQLRNSAGLNTRIAHTLVNAAGPWVDELLGRCTPRPGARPFSLVKGSHIALPAANLPGIFYVEAPGDGRALFIMPWHGRTLVGTTEVEVSQPHAEISDAEIDYLLATARHYFPQLPLCVEESFAGVRVLPAGSGRAFSRARESIIEPALDNTLISIYGGKLTTYRHTAEIVVQLLQHRLGPRQQRANTRTLAL